LNTKNILLLLSAVAAGLVAFGQQHIAPPEHAKIADVGPTATAPVDRNDSVVDRAFADHAHHVQVDGRGVVVRILREDDQGSRHQKFLLRMPSGLTILLAHNIDLAPPIEGLRVGDEVEFNGDYEWNEKGGLVHWTHGDPSGRHVAGWLKHGGHTYQ
jgi:hypothetical protein